jgi:hypothetical protein
MKRQNLFTVARSRLLSAALGGATFSLSAVHGTPDPMVWGQTPSPGQNSAIDRGPGWDRPGGSWGHSPATSARASSEEQIHLPYAQFQIPFNVDPSGPVPKQIQLWVSTDDGASWQLHGTATPEAGQFPFRAASEGGYLFSVRTIDQAGSVFPSNSPPLRVYVDTTKPAAAIRADVDEHGLLSIDLRVHDLNLDPNSGELRMRTDRSAQWQRVAIPPLVHSGQFYSAQITTAVGPCREVALALSIRDTAGNEGEATYLLSMPRTAQAEADLRLASTGGDASSAVVRGQQSAIAPLQGATEWRPEARPATAGFNNPMYGQRVGQLASSEPRLFDGSRAALEELPLPNADRDTFTSHPSHPGTVPDQYPGTVPSQSEGAGASSLGQAYHCRSRAFSLDYSVEALGGGALADVELWGTEDGGREWSKWGSDPDRQSPFDVQVGNDGLFGFRMVVIGANGYVSNRPKDGDPADVWINIDTAPPSVKISRAVYGEGPETGMLVVDYQCTDSHLVERPVSLAYSQSPDGPWNTFVSGLKNTGIYLWKASPALPDRIYLKIEAVDKAGNVGSHRLDLPIDTKGLAPRGRIHGFRPIAN